MTIAEDRKGNALLEFLPIAEESIHQIAVDAPLTHSLIIVACREEFVFVHDVWKDEWELPGGGIKAGETPRQCAVRELLEETELQLSDLIFKGLMKFRLAPDGRIEYGGLFACRAERVGPFEANAEIDAVTLWDLRRDIGRVAEIDKHLAVRFGR